MTIRILQLFLVIILSLSFVCGCSVAMYATEFRDAANTGKIQIGMKKDDVRKLLGTPQDVSTRQLKDGIREVWVYRDRNFKGRNSEDRSDREAWQFATAFTLGVAAIFMFPPTDSHYLVLRDGEVIGWDMTDIDAPDLIFEKRER